MTHCSEMARSSWVEIGMAAYGLHAVSDPLVHFFQSRANSLIWSWFPQVKYTVSPVSAPCTAKWEHLRIPGANAVGKAAQGLRLRASLHAESSWSPPTWQNRINRKVLIWSIRQLWRKRCSSLILKDYIFGQNYWVLYYNDSRNNLLFTIFSFPRLSIVPWIH